MSRDILSRHALRAYTILELLVSMTIIFGTCGCLFGMIAMGTSAVRGTKNTSVSSALAQSKMEELQVMPLASISAQKNGRFPAPHSAFLWDSDISEFSIDFKLLTVRAWTPGSPYAVINRLLPSPPLSSIDSHIYDGEAAAGASDSKFSFTRFSGDPRIIRNYAVRGLNGDSEWKTGALCGFPGQGLVWTAHAALPRIGRCIFDESGECVQTDIFEVPVPSKGYPPLIKALASDRMGNFVFCADAANRALWVLNDTAAGGRPSWNDGYCLVCDSNPLGDLAGAACDKYGCIVWLCEGSQRRLRNFYWGSSPYSGAEAAGTYGYWGDVYNVPFKDGSDLRGVAVSGAGTAVYTMDASSLYGLLYIENSVRGLILTDWFRTTLPEELKDARPADLWVDENGSRLNFIAASSELWSASIDKDGRVSASSFSRMR